MTAKREHGTALNEEEIFVVTPSYVPMFYHVLPNNDASPRHLDSQSVNVDLNHLGSTCHIPQSSVPRLDMLSTGSYQEYQDSNDCPETESQCTGFPVEALDDNGYYDEDTEEEAWQRRTSKAVFILHFAVNADVINRILQLAISLRKFHVDVTLDLFERDNPPNSWPMWYEENIRTSEVVLCVITENFYLKLIRGNHVISQSMYSIMNDSNTAFRAVFLDVPEQMEDVPPSMRGSTCYCISSQHLNFEDEEFVSLYAFLTGQNRTAKPELGEMVVLPNIQRKLPCTQGQLKASNNATISSSQEKHMFGAEGGKEANADTEADNYGLSRMCSSDSSDDELVTVNSVGYPRSGPEYGLWRGLATPDRIAHRSVIGTTFCPKILEEKQQPSIMEFNQTLFADNPGTRLMQGYPDNLPCDPYDQRRLNISRSRHLSSSAVHSIRPATELPLPPYRDPPLYVPPMRPVYQSWDESSDFDLSESLPRPGITCIPQSFYSQDSVHSISSTLVQLSSQHSSSEQSLQYHSSSGQLDVHITSRYSSISSLYRASYSLNCASTRSEQFAHFQYRHSSYISLTSEIAEPTDSWSSDSDCSEYPPPPPFTGCFSSCQRLSLSRASGRSHPQYSNGHAATPHPDHSGSRNNRPCEAECPTCRAVFTVDHDNQVLSVTLPCRLDVPFVQVFRPLEPSSNRIDSNSPHPSSSSSTVVSPHSSTRSTATNHRRRKRKRKCVIL